MVQGRIKFITIAIAMLEHPFYINYNFYQVSYLQRNSYENITVLVSIKETLDLIFVMLI